uniref:NADH-ubiquinone oxidoreductase chain 5 n=1 Tax=Gyraulus sp. GE1 TaxID=2880038 RepID=A0A976LY53_9GAST|nr:NADH dehydrogenase subunit 5 [Gyraulus sp. GE1]
MFKSKNQFTVMLFCMALMFTYMYLSLPCTILEFNVMSMFSYDLTFSLLFDKVSLLFGIVVSLIACMVFLFSSNYMKEDKYMYRFNWILLSFVISMYILVFSGSLLVILIGWDGLGISSFVLIIYYEGNEALVSGFQTFLINRFGDIFMILSFILFLFMGIFQLSDKISYLITVVLGLAAMTKSAQYPFSSWLPAAMAAPTPVSALVHSSTLVTAGIYLIIRMNTFSNMSDTVMSMLLFFGSITCFLGGAAALFEYDLKKIIALSTLSQLGLMVFTLGLGYPNLALFHLFTHALFKALLFLSAGSFLMCTFSCQDIRYMGSISNTMPFCGVILNICVMCLMGLPFLSAFYSKHAILEKLLMSNINSLSLLIIVIATFFTVMYSIRLVKCMYWKKFTVIPYITKFNNLSVNIPMLVLSLFAIFSGKLFLVEEWFLEYTLPSSMLFNYLVIFGIIFMMIFSMKYTSYSMSSLFFLTPLYNNSGIFLNKFMKNLSMLDYGWLEIGPKLNIQLSNLSWVTYKLYNWPKLSYSLLRVLFVVLIL